jgi:hypothetical protein
VFDDIEKRFEDRLLRDRQRADILSETIIQRVSNAFKIPVKPRQKSNETSFGDSQLSAFENVHAAAVELVAIASSGLSGPPYQYLWDKLNSQLLNSGWRNFQGVTDLFVSSEAASFASRQGLSGNPETDNAFLQNYGEKMARLRNMHLEDANTETQEVYLRHPNMEGAVVSLCWSSYCSGSATHFSLRFLTTEAFFGILRKSMDSAFFWRSIKFNYTNRGSYVAASIDVPFRSGIGVDFNASILGNFAMERFKHHKIQCLPGQMFVHLGESAY